MRRIYLSHRDRQKLFQLVKSDKNGSSAASFFGVSTRTFRDWQRGKYSIPEKVFLFLQEKYKGILRLNPRVIEESVIKSKNGKKGAQVRYKKYGNPGTKAGRVKGGQRSVVVQQHKHTKFKILKRFSTIKKTTKLAEFIGIMLGDGGMTHYQARVTLHRHDDYNYAQYIKTLCFVLFNEYPTISTRKNIVELVLSGKALVNHLNTLGLVTGNKIIQHIAVPTWVYERPRWVKSVLRGIFDTDGCVYQDTHNISGRSYASIGVAYTSYSLNLQRDIYKSLQSLGLSPTRSTKNRIMLRRKEDVKKFFTIVQPRNIKHIIRYKRFLEE